MYSEGRCSSFDRSGLNVWMVYSAAGAGAPAAGSSPCPLLCPLEMAMAMRAVVTRPWWS